MNADAIKMFSTAGVAVLCIVLGIIVLTVFFQIVASLNSRGPKPEAITIRGVLKKDTFVTVHTSNTETFEHVRFIGFTNADSFKNPIPYDLHGMVILENKEGYRYIIRAKSIRMITVEPNASNDVHFE